MLSRTPRLALWWRFGLLLGEFAVFSTLIALMVVERGLNADLRQAEVQRLERTGKAVEAMVQEHVEDLVSRCEVVAHSPQFLANLETGHRETLEFYAAELREALGARAVAFVDPRRELNATAGEPQMIQELLARQEGGERGSRLIGVAGELGVLAELPLRVADTSRGMLLVLQPLGRDQLMRWSKIAGVNLRVQQDPPDDLEAGGEAQLLVRSVDGMELVVVTDFELSRQAVGSSRISLLQSGLLAVLFAMVLGLILARRILLPVRDIQAGAERIASGDLHFRLDERRNDEIGDIARAMNAMLAGLEESRSRLRTAQQLACLGDWGIESESGRVQGSAEFFRIYGLRPRPEGVSMTTLLGRVHPDDRERFSAAVAACRDDGQIMRLDHRTIPIDGEERTLHSDAVHIGGRMMLEGTVQDISERKRIEERVRHLAYHDSLTGLPNRRLLREHLARWLRQIEESDGSLALLYMDIDGFKYVNDTLGHAAGDALLEVVATRLVAATKEMEGETMVSRLGGDEFTVVMLGIADLDQAGAEVERILQRLGEPCRIEGQDLSIGASVGVALAPTHAQEVEDLLCRADIAMYHAKQGGQSGHAFYTDTMQEAAYRRVKMDHRLRRAIENQELELAYQPKVSLPDRRIVGVEALLRWRDPELGIIEPSEFIPLAEETGVVNMLGEWVLRQAVTQGVHWAELGHSDLKVAVNLSARQMEASEQLVESVASVLRDTGFDPEQLELEITESMMLRDEQGAVALCEKLRGLGVGLSLDDFGTGYSSLSHLRQLPIDTLKIDQRFVRRITTDEDDAALAASIVSMARLFGLVVVVEGVETEEQLAILQKLRCDQVQGFLISPAVSAEEMGELLGAEERRQDRRQTDRRRSASPVKRRRASPSSVRRRKA